MKWVWAIDEVESGHGTLVGGKATALSQLARNGLVVPRTLCVPAAVYQYFLEATGLEERIMTELNRKPFDRMRWEEVWDSALRIRNMFLTAALPDDVAAALNPALAEAFGDQPVAVRSSAPEEDSARASFAGLHESYLNVRGPGEILNHIRLVWASIWSDAALLYRQELGLDARRSTMAVVVQALEAGGRSGVYFGVNPNDAEQSVIEAVYGLNQGLVDGEIAPDRWIIDRMSGRVIDHSEPERAQRMVPGAFGVSTEALPSSLANQPPLSRNEVDRIVSAGRRAESLFGSPQDVEWTLTDHGLVILQSRPITSGDGTPAGDKRAWYLSLHRSFENLKALEAKIIERLIPQMIEAAEEMAEADLQDLSSMELVAEITRRRSVNDHWVQVYWSDFRFITI